MSKIQYVKVWAILTALIGAAGCGGDGAAPSRATGPWGNDVTVIESDGTETDYQAPAGGACTTANCIRANERCGEGVAADVVLDTDGNVVDIVCYPTTGTLTPEEIESHAGNVAQNLNGAVVVLDDAADGIDLDGDLAIDANNVVVYGSGPDVSVMAGDLTVDGNNTIVRGIRVLGDADIPKNDSVILYCVIEGNVRIVGNNNHLSGCDVFGSVRIEGNNNVLNGNRIQGTIESIGTNSCNDNLSFSDVNQDLVIDPAELGTALGC